ncbi:MAG: DUF2190 family protein [Rhizobacter sp.]
MNIALLTLTVAASAALSANRFVTATGGVPAAAANAVGVTRTSAAAAGDLVPVDMLGTTQVEAGAAVAAGAAVETNASGQAITRSAGVTLGRALTAATAAGQLIEVLLIPN